jgi:uncharacterized damage-inducible protein DinB
MTIAHALLREFDEEMAATRTTLERVPEASFSWKPHEKSMPLGRLATLCAELPGWIVNALERDELDIFPPGSPPPKWEAQPNLNAVLELFDKNAAAARKALLATPDAEFGKPWAFKVQGKVVSTDPKAHVYRRSALNHLVQHRAQLGVYFRLLGVPVPAIYGPSADERGG